MNQKDEPLNASAESPQSEDSAIARAIAFGVDTTLLRRNLRMTATERVRQADEARDSVLALQQEVRRWREQQRSNE